VTGLDGMILPSSIAETGMNDAMNTPTFPLRRLVLFLLALCGLITAVAAVTVFQARAEFPAWFCPVFLAGTALLLATIGLYAGALLRRRIPESADRGSPGWLWFALIASVLCTSSLHQFSPFRPDVATIWAQMPPHLKLIQYNFILTAGNLLTVVGLAVLFLRGRRHLAAMGLPILAGIMLIPNDDCGNAFNLPWIAWIGASPLMFLCNSVVLLIGYGAWHGLWPRRSVLVMCGINVGVLLLGFGHITQVVWGARDPSQAMLQRQLDRNKQRQPASLNRIPLEGHASFYVCSDARLGFKEGLPVIICIGHTFQEPETLVQFVGKFDEPVLLIWSDLLADISGDTSLEDGVVWERKRQEFAGELSRYRELLSFDERRVYLTGFSFAGAYAWMLAYDRPDLYAGVVAMSAPSYPPPIQQRLDSGKSVVTVVVRGEKDKWFPEHLAQEKQTGHAIEARNPHSRFLLQPGEDHREVAKYWLENLNYILQFNKRG